MIISILTGPKMIFFSFLTGLLLASWLSWQELTKYILHLGNHGTFGRILIPIVLRQCIIPRSYLITMDKILR